MAKGFKHGAWGGAPLNFKVVGNPQPTNPKENTIWLNTDVPIGAWYFATVQPENLAPGDVWFPVGTSSPVKFNALKKNGIMVYPLSAKQYAGGALVDVTAKSYHGGEWVDWITYLYKSGDEYTGITGGWVSSGFSSPASSGLSVASATKNADRMSFSSSSSSMCVSGTANQIPLDSIEKVTVKYQNNSLVSGFGLQLSVQSGTTIETDSKLLKKFSGAVNSVVTEFVEIPSGAGDCYIIFYCSGGRNADILEISYEGHRYVAIADLDAAYQEGVNSAYD